MAHPAPVLDLLLVDDDDILIVDARSIGHTAIQIVIASDAAEARRLLAARHFDAIALNVGLAGGIDLIERLSADSLGAPVIAIAAQGAGGRSLEHTLTLAELRGAAASYPKPIDAIELVAAAVGVVARTAKAGPGVAALSREFEAMIGVG